MALRNLILGSQGFVGQPLCKYLNSCGEEAIEYDIKLCPDMDLRQDRKLATFIKKQHIDRVYFLAWDVGGAKYLYDPLQQTKQLEWNTDIVRVSMPQLAKAEVPFLFISSQMVGQMNAYGVTKRLGEVWAKEAGGMSLRLWNVYGPLEEPSEHSHVIGDMVWQAVKESKISLMTNGMEQRRFVHVNDVCRAMHSAFDHYKMASENGIVEDIGSYDPIRVSRVAHMIAEIVDGVDIGYSDKPGFVQDMFPYRPPIWYKTSQNLYEGLSRMVMELKSK